MSRVPYVSTVGSLMYAMVCTRPKITNVVGVLSRYMSKPGKEHSTIEKRVFRYLCGTTSYGLCYQGRPVLDIMLTYMGLFMKIGLEIWITECLQVGMCLTYLEDKSVG